MRTVAHSVHTMFPGARPLRGGCRACAWNLRLDVDVHAVEVSISPGGGRGWLSGVRPTQGVSAMEGGGREAARPPLTPTYKSRLLSET